MKKNNLKLCILRLLMFREMYGYEIGKHLSSKGLSSQLSYIYQILSEMKKDSLIKSYWLQRSLGVKRKVYSLDTRGWQELQNTLRKLIGDVHEFYMDYPARLPPEKWLLKWGQMITDIVPDVSNKTIVYVATNPNIKCLQVALKYSWEQTKGDVYLVTNKSEILNNNHKKLVVMNGDHMNIPLKQNFADAVIAFDPPKPETLGEAVAEFCRVVKNEGATAIGYPNIEEQDDPLTIGAFIERIQYGLDKYEPIDFSVLKSTFETYFQSVTSTKTADFTFFIGKTKKTKTQRKNS